MNRRLLTIIIAAVVIIGAPVAWYLVSPLFIDQTVDEAFPFDLPSADEMSDMTMDEKNAVVEQVVDMMNDKEAMESLSEDEMETLETQVQEIAAEMPDKEMEEEMPEAESSDGESAGASEWVIAAQGEFMDADDFHKGSGTATIFQQGENAVLRFENFESTNGPDLHVLLVENVDGTSSAELGDYVDLGSLKGNIGNQNYEIPADVDLSKYSGVMIYCMPFHVVFSTAAF